MTSAVQIFTGFLGSLGFGILFNIRGNRLITAALGGLSSWALFLGLGLYVSDEIVRYFIVSVAVSVYCEIMARILKTPTTTFLITALIPLIPGGGLYYTMTTAFSGNFAGFTEKGIHTLALAVALALGVIVTTVITNIVTRFKTLK